MRLGYNFAIFALCTLLGAVSGTASAAALSFTGTFAGDDQLGIFSFVAGPGSAILRTWGYAGGTNANGMVISSGGFDPVLSLFGPGPSLLPSTDLLNFNNDGGPSVPADPASFEHFDSLINSSAVPIVLNPGATYFLVLSVSDNVPLTNKYGGGFSEQGNGNFTGPLYGCGSAPFCDIDVDQRNGNWAVDITGVESAVDLSSSSPTVPEPSTFWMLGCAAALGLALHRTVSRRKVCR
jgi:hypothetical protein